MELGVRYSAVITPSRDGRKVSVGGDKRQIAMALAELYKMFGEEKHKESEAARRKDLEILGQKV